MNAMPGQLTNQRSSRLASVNPAWWLLGILLLIYPLLVSQFFTLQIGAYSLILGTIALSLMMLAGYGGMVSLAQLSVAGLAGYLFAIFSVNNANIGPEWPWWLAALLAIGIGCIAATLIGAISVRTEGIYTIMITLAIAVAFFYFVRQNYTIFNGFTGFSGIKAPTVFGIYWRDPVPFYYLCLFVATLFFLVVLYASRSTFGLSMQAVRDNPRRASALGYNVNAHRIAAYTLAGLIASTAGVLSIWFNGRISPGSVGVDIVIDILVIAVVGGLAHPIGPFIGAVLFVLLENFAIDLIDRERFNTVIGLAFLLIVFFSPDGILGLWQRLKHKLHPGGVSDSIDRWRSTGD
jgi:branched-chain amino acid transport system permease protein